MEQKRTLWIITAVGLFLVAVLGGALIVTSLSSRKSQTIASSGYSDKNTSSNGWISIAPTNTPAPIPEQTEAVEDTIDMSDFDSKTVSADNVTVFADNATIYSDSTTTPEKTVQPVQTVINNTTTIDLNAMSNRVAVNAEAPKAEKPAKEVKSAKKESSEKTAVAAVTKKSAPVSKAPAAAKEEASKAVKNTSVAEASKAASKPASKTVKTSAAPAAPQKTVYWIQVTALTSRKSADAARDTLGENQITADVFTYKDNKDQLFYRVRVGPYTTKSEAEYWKTKIAKIDSFKNNASYITSTPVEAN